MIDKSKFVDIPGYEGLYAINRNGEIWSYKSNKKIKSCIVDNYYKIGLRKNGKRILHGVHKLLAKAFIPNPLEKPIPHHKDSNGLNNSLDNLEWVTQSENMYYAVADGTLNTKEHKLKVREANRHLSDEEVLNIRKFYSNGQYSQRQLAKKFNVCQRTITMIVNKITFREIC